MGEIAGRQLTPEEMRFRARVFVNKFGDSLQYAIDNPRVALNNAKSCAIICIDELIMEIEPDELFQRYNERVTYWRDIKEEIQKL